MVDKLDIYHGTINSILLIFFAEKLCLFTELQKTPVPTPDLSICWRDSVRYCNQLVCVQQSQIVVYNKITALNCPSKRIALKFPIVYADYVTGVMGNDLLVTLDINSIIRMYSMDTLALGVSISIANMMTW